LNDDEEVVDGYEKDGDLDQPIPLHQSGRKSQTFQLHPEHIQSGKRAQRLQVHQSTYYIPVAIGPALPWRDRELMYPKYHCLMLILFEPWRGTGDLRKSGETWVQAFDRFMESCPDEIKHVLNNMQVMHECKDAKDIEDNWRRDDREALHSKWSGGNEVEEFTGEAINDDLLEHLDSVVNYASHVTSMYPI